MPTTFVCFSSVNVQRFQQILKGISFFFFTYLLTAVLGLRFCARAFSSCGERGPLFIEVRGPLAIAASLVAEHRLQTHRLSNCGSRAPLLRGMWDLPRPGLKPVSPALAGGFLTTVPPGKPSKGSLNRDCSELYLFLQEAFPDVLSDWLRCLLWKPTASDLPYPSPDPSPVTLPSQHKWSCLAMHLCPSLELHEGRDQGFLGH